MIARIISLVTKEFIHLRRDWWMPAFMLFGGLTELLLVGWATSRPITNLPLIILDQDKSIYSRRVVEAFENTTTFNLRTWMDDLSTVQDALKRGSVNAALIILAGFSRDYESPTGRPVLVVLLNGSETTAGMAALRSIEGVVRNLGEHIALQRLGLESEQFAGFDPSLRVWFNEALSDALYTVPAELALMLEFTVLIFAALAFARERELGTLEQLLVMPFSSLEIIVGKSIPAILISFVDFILMLTMVHFVFDVPVRGSLVLLLMIAFGYLMVELGKGLVISVVSRTQHQAFLLVMLVGMVDFMFTGYAAPVESMPQVLQWLGNFVPANHWLSILRGVLLKGVGLEVLWPHVVALLLLGVVIGTLSIRYVRRALT
ncbi:MAG: ABC transporter permease [Chloroflexota bacterium]